MSDHLKVSEKFVEDGVSRRDFMKFCATAATLAGLVEVGMVQRVAEAVTSAATKPPVIWLEGQDCAGCSISVTNSLNPPIASIILDKISLRYHEALMVASGSMAEKVRQETIAQGGHVLIVEGSIPTADDRYCMVGGHPFSKIVKESAEKASAIIAIGACASFGGIPAATPTKGIGVGEFLNKPVVNLPTCPVHTDHFVGALIYLLVKGAAPPLDKLGRPMLYYSQLIHDNCRRRAFFDEEKFLTDWNDPQQQEWCLFEKGCKGPDTYSDCPIRRWNDGVNFCLDCGAPCQGCSEPTFYEKNSPLYKAAI
ncbi:hydrogenase small subunit [candidate division CSSED10-310 bacterium]|uniref:Hydrogenase small subunit n=1 Tax=candidate division CSSED10-310 bacterium TaxID=2855610 RepID=A0ABV6Z212_UNCC1